MSNAWTLFWWASPSLPGLLWCICGIVMPLILSFHYPFDKLAFPLNVLWLLWSLCPVALCGLVVGKCLVPFHVNFHLGLVVWLSPLALASLGASVVSDPLHEKRMPVVGQGWWVLLHSLLISGEVSLEEVAIEDVRPCQCKGSVLVHVLSSSSAIFKSVGGVVLASVS